MSCEGHGHVQRVVGPRERQRGRGGAALTAPRHVPGQLYLRSRQVRLSQRST